MQRTAPRRIQAPQRRGKITAHVDPDGTVYAVGGSGFWGFIGASIVCMLIGAGIVMLRFSIPATAMIGPLPTAAVMTATARPAPTQERRQEGGAEQSGSADSPPAQEQPAALPPSGDVREPAQTPTPLPGIPAADASEEEIQAWLDGPVSTPTPLPEPGEAGFAESFEEQGCSPFVGYLPGDPCVAILKQQAGE